MGGYLYFLNNLKDIKHPAWAYVSYNIFFQLMIKVFKEYRNL